MESIFKTLNAVNVKDKTEKKNGLTYLSWAWAWAEVKKVCPDAQYTIYERETEFGPVNYFTDGKTCWVKTGVTLNGLEHIEQLPVMDYKNKSIPLNAVTSTDVNKTIQRSLTKACARHGLGLYIYAGEDLPEDEKDALLEARKNPSKAAPAPPKETPTQPAKDAEKPVSGASGMATEEQKQFIRDNASDDDYISIMQEFGAELENLSESDARHVINEVEAHNADKTPKCVRCNKIITGVALPDGKTMTASELIGKSKIAYGDVYCFDCMKALKKAKNKKAG
jgi:ribosomal protein L34E